MSCFMCYVINGVRTHTHAHTHARYSFNIKEDHKYTLLFRNGLRQSSDKKRLISQGGSNYSITKQKHAITLGRFKSVL